ncbi:DEAD/DEAH box helicase family protein [candidate division WOR-3 bacterium]|nr:DEAD/DEAH box helicase family protein [candidate division WOR-3 bacterium]
MGLTEADTRLNLVDPLLGKALWNLADHTQVGIEIPVQGYDPTPWRGITDYCLYGESGDVLAIVEAKKCSRDARDGEEQLRQYISEVSRKQSYVPFGFMSNGRKTWFWDVGHAHPRLVAGFFTRADLNRLLFQRLNALPLSDTQINTRIVNRPYQHQAVRRVIERFSQGRRRALLVMATGTGKTRTTMALIDLFLRTNQASHVLFLADRDALVEQALTDGFKAHLPNEPRDRIYTSKVDLSKRLFVATEQTMNVCYRKFSPAFFDLIVFDEAHRSIFNRLSVLFEYFDARMVGLTATPAAFLDRNTFQTFECDGNVPTFLYSYEEAVDEHHLVDFNLYQAQTRFQRSGIKGAELSEEDRNALIEQGIDPDLINYEGTDIEVLVTNKDTLRKQWSEVMDRCLKDRSGQIPGKTIVFAITQKHAERMRDVFEEMYPQHVGMVKLIHSDVERVHDGPWGDGLITQFKKNDQPRIAISVDMLDTGIDVPEVVNLVFMKPVFSGIKLWQMLGRGTRNDEACRYRDRLPDGKKTEFLILDFWQNDFQREPSTQTPQTLPILVSLFNTRLKLLEASLPMPESAARKQALTDIRAMIARIPLDSFPVQKVYSDVEQAWQDEFWVLLTPEKIDFLRDMVGPLLRFAGNVDVAAETFTHKVERLRISIVNRRPSAANVQSIGEDVSRLPPYVAENPEAKAAMEICLSQRLLEASTQELTDIIRLLAPHMRNRRERPTNLVAMDLPDFIASSGLITISADGKQVLVEEYRKQVESRVLAIVEEHPVLLAIRDGKPVTEEQLVELERVLNRELGQSDLHVTEETIRKAYGIRASSFLALLRYLLHVDAIPDYAAVVRQAFDRHITAHAYNADQIRFLRSVQTVFIQKRRLSEDDLYGDTFAAFGRNAVERLLSPQDVKDLLALTAKLAA